jgi:hypothetical protein
MMKMKDFLLQLKHKFYLEAINKEKAYCLIHVTIVNLLATAKDEIAKTNKKKNYLVHKKKK